MSAEMTQADVEQPQKSGFLDAGTIALLVGLVTFIGVVGFALTRQNQTQPTDGERAPNFEVTTFDGEALTLDGLRGNVVVVNFWASWCVPCRDEAPLLEATWQQYKDDDFVMIGLAHSDIRRDSLAFIEEFGITYPNAIDVASRAYERYNLQGVPETFVIDQDGRVAYFVYGPLGQQTLAGMTTTIERLLAEGA